LISALEFTMTLSAKFAASFLIALAPAAFAADNPLAQLKWRLVGPFRGGRVVAVAGVPSQPNVYYFGGVAGGVFKTTDGGHNWTPIADGQLKTSSVGAIGIAPSDPNVIYLGMGESPIRGDVVRGDGVYNSTDAGKTWKHVGLAATEQISRVRVHPTNPDIVYVAALGHVFGANPERGIFRTTDGGKTWQKILFRSDKAGASDLAMDPTNPRILYAAFWEARRTPYSLESGGPGSSLYKSTDGGDTWTELTHNPGLPKGTLGRIGVAVSPAEPERVWAMVEAEDGGLFRSDNAGKTWTRVNEDRKLRQRAWYYSNIYADPKNADTVYALNVGFFRSEDGGRTFNPIATPHGDNHDLWIAPDDPLRMIEGNDGGANVTTDGGRTWTDQQGQPTAQFYRVALDNDFPYHIYGAQQDNSTVCIASRTGERGITQADWYDVGGGESGWIQPSPKNSAIVYAGSYDGLITRYDHRTGEMRRIDPWPDNPMGYGAADLKYRFQWNFPIVTSPHDPNTLYAGAQMLFKTTNDGQTWEVISPDLTRNDKSKQGPSGGPITKDNTSVEYYDTIFTVMESPIQKGLIWVGTDDGLVQLTRDGGKTWTNVTPKDMPEWIQINSIEASPHDAGTAYFAGTMYKSDDQRPYLYMTRDYGKTWTRINHGIPDDAYTRVIREDPVRKGLLFAGTETGIYVSFDYGENWQSLQLNLPVTPVADLAIQARDGELVAATHGRAFWILDDLNVLRQWSPEVSAEDAHLFEPKPAYRWATSAGGGPGGPNAGQNPPAGAVIWYSLKQKPEGEVTLEFLDSAGKLVRKFSTKEAPKPPEQNPEEEEGGGRRGPAPAKLTAEAGLNRFVWDLRYEDATRFPGMILWGGNTRGPLAIPGAYQVRLTVNGKPLTQKLEVRKDPRLATTPEQFAEQLAFSLEIRDKLTATNSAVLKIRDVRKQVDELAARSGNARVADAAKSLAKKLTGVEEALYQTKNRSSEDPLNFPVQLNDKLAAVGSAVAESAAAPTAQERAVYKELAGRIDAQLQTLDRALKEDLPALNKLAREENVPAITLR
jgi:photosystem II stability/assembly factor-like uncharacterized protein